MDAGYSIIVRRRVLQEWLITLVDQRPLSVWAAHDRLNFLGASHDDILAVLPPEGGRLRMLTVADLEGRRPRDIERDARVESIARRVAREEWDSRNQAHDLADGHTRPAGVPAAWPTGLPVPAPAPTPVVVTGSPTGEPPIPVRRVPTGVRSRRRPDARQAMLF